jgi:hypothetical protein
VQVQVMKVVTEQRTMQVPRVVEKKTPYTYTVRMPRTVVTKVPLDPCGNPVPVSAAAPAAVAAPALSAAPAIEQVPAPAAAARPETPAASTPLKTFSDKPADAPAPAGDGWTASSLQQIAPTPATDALPRVAEKPALEPALAPAAESVPTVAPAGPTVEPAPPAHDPRDVPAAKTSGAGLLKPLVTPGHTT